MMLLPSYLQCFYQQIIISTGHPFPPSHLSILVAQLTETYKTFQLSESSAYKVGEVLLSQDWSDRKLALLYRPLSLYDLIFGLPIGTSLPVHPQRNHIKWLLERLTLASKRPLCDKHLERIQAV